MSFDVSANGAQLSELGNAWISTAPDMPEIDAVVTALVPSSALVTWEAVTTQFDESGPGTGLPLTGPIVKYSVTAETDDDGDDKVLTLDVLSGTSTTIPAAFLDPDRDWKVEIGAFEEGGNSTFRELPFCTHDQAECPDED